MRQDEQVELYKKLGVENEYSVISGKFVLPVAQASPTTDAAKATFVPCVVVQAFAPYRTRKVSYGVMKDCTPPQIPQPTSSGPYTFIEGVVQIPFPSVNTAGTFSWSVGLEYMYIENVYTDHNTGYVLGQTPYVWQTQEDDSQLTTQNPAPVLVNQCGIGPKVGWAQSQLVDFAQPLYQYREPSYFPPVFHSVDLIVGPNSYIYSPF